MEKLIQAALIAWNPFLAVEKRKEEGKLRIEDVLVPFVAVIVASKVVEFKALRYWLEALFYAMSSAAPNIPPLLSNEFAQEFLAAFGALFPIGALFFLPKSSLQPYGASPIAAAILIITSSFTFYGSAIAATMYVLSGTMIEANPSGAQNFLWFSTMGALAIIPIAIGLWSKILLGVVGLPKRIFSVVTISYIAGIAILVAIIGVGTGDF